MPLIRSGLSSTLGAACTRAARPACTANARYFSSSPRLLNEQGPKTDPEEAPTAVFKGSSMLRKETPAEAMARHQPDYNATVDHGTS